MIINRLEIPDVFHIVPEPLSDSRGYFMRSFCANELYKSGIHFKVLQTNLSYNNRKATLRGMHYQKEPDTEAKIVQCLQGSFFDVAVDLRKESGSYLKWVGYTLSAENKDMLYIPNGFAHGYITLEKNTLIQYLMSEKYVAHSGSGVRFDDPKLNIRWPLNPSEISEKDLHWNLIE